jgi:60 kDa SS-A/Ro ribonucleoprotein
MEYVEGLRGWGGALRRGVSAWYANMDAERLAFQAVKYQQRDGWSHRDALRLAHPKAPTDLHDQLFNWITQGWEAEHLTEMAPDEPALKTIWAFEQAKRATTEEVILKLIEAHNLPWEAIPSNWHGSTAVWRKLLPNLPMTALIRNLARLTAHGVLKSGGADTKQVVARLRNPEQLVRARIHPVAALSALMTYQQGKGMRGSLTWEPITAVIDALDKAFYKTFKTVEPTGKRLVLALDVSGSMAGGMVAGVPGLSPLVASAAMALVTAATESDVTIIGFSSQMVRLNISARQRLDDVVKTVSGLPFMGTDCALPMLWALENGVKADAFVIYTDSETWFGNIHPAQALREYREKTGIPAKLIVVGMVSNGFSIADPTDGGMLDVVGFDTAVPQVMNDFLDISKR